MTKILISRTILSSVWMSLIPSCSPDDGGYYRPEHFKIFAWHFVQVLDIGLRLAEIQYARQSSSANSHLTGTISTTMRYNHPISGSGYLRRLGRTSSEALVGAVKLCLWGRNNLDRFTNVLGKQTLWDNFTTFPLSISGFV